MSVLPVIDAESLGSAAFREAHGVRLAYVAGSMVQAISSEALVIRMARARLLAYFGSGGLPLARVEEGIETIRAALQGEGVFGVNLLSSPMRPEREEETVDLFLGHGVARVEASAFTQVTPSLVRYRLAGLYRGGDGRVRTRHLLQAKLSRPEVALQFLSPAPERIVARLLDARRITPEQAALGREIPMADDICVEADSGGHTDQGVAACLIPSIVRLRDELFRRLGLSHRVRIGAAGGLGSPEAVAAAFVLGAEFVLTGSINQCSVEAGTSDVVKDLLQQAEVQDTAMAPAGDMFEVGARVQVLKKGLFFPARANKLYELYRRYESLEQLDPKTREQIEQKFFRASFEQVRAEVEAHVRRRSPAEWERLCRSPKLMMARLFQWYFARTNRAAIAGHTEDKLNFQIHCGPAMGACNRWLKGTRLESWRERHVDELGELLMRGAAQVLSERFAALSGATVPAFERASTPGLAARAGEAAA